MLKKITVWAVMVLTCLVFFIPLSDNIIGYEPPQCIHRGIEVQQDNTITSLPFLFNFAFARGSIMFSQLINNYTALSSTYFFMSLFGSTMTWEMEWSVIDVNGTLLRDSFGGSERTWWCNPHQNPICKPYVYGGVGTLFTDFKQGEAWLRVFFRDKLIFEGYCNLAV